LAQQSRSRRSRLTRISLIGESIGEYSPSRVGFTARVGSAA
jgi:hypothetical protein